MSDTVRSRARGWSFVVHDIVQGHDSRATLHTVNRQSVSQLVGLSTRLHSSADSEKGVTISYGCLLLLLLLLAPPELPNGG